MNTLKYYLAPFQIERADYFYECYADDINYRVKGETLSYPPSEVDHLSSPAYWTPANWKWFLETSGKITVHLQSNIS